jgi:hypothetical protein
MGEKEVNQFTQSPEMAGIAGGNSHSFVVELNTGGRMPALFFVPGVARPASSMMNFATRIRQHRVFGLEYPGMDANSKPIDNVEGLAGFFISQMRSIQPKGPYYMAGVCFGGTIAYEMACQLQASGEDVGLVVLMDTGVPPRATDKLNEKSLGYYLRRIGLLLHPKRFVSYVSGMWTQLRRKIFKQGPRRSRLDDHVRLVLRSLMVAKKGYLPPPYSGPALILLRGFLLKTLQTRQANEWKRLAQNAECIYIPNTTHDTIFVQEQSVNMICQLLNSRLPAGSEAAD